MTIEANTGIFGFQGDGTTTVFGFPSKFLAPADILVVVNSTIQTTGFTVSGAGNPSGGYVTFAVPPANFSSVLLIRDPSASQLTHFVDGSSVLAGTLENTVDKLTMIVQRQRYLLGRTLHLREGDFDGSGVFDTGGNRISGLPTPGGFTDPVRLQELTNTTNSLTALVTAEAAQRSADDAAERAARISGDQAEAAARNAAVAALAMNAGFSAASVMTRETIPLVAIPVDSFRTVNGARWVKGTSTGPMAIADKSGQYWIIDVGGEVALEWFLYPSDTNASDAFDRALAGVTAGSIRILSKSVTVARPIVTTSQQAIRGWGDRATLIIAAAPMEYVIRLGAKCVASDLAINANLNAKKGVSMQGVYATCERVDVTYALRDTVTPGTVGTGGAGSAFFNENGSVRFLLKDCTSSNNRFSFYAQGGVNNCRITGHNSLGFEDYGLFVSHEGDDEFTNNQGFRVSDSSFIGNLYGVVGFKKLFDFVFQNSVIDVCYVSGILLAEDNSAVLIGPGNFISASNGGYGVRIGSGSNAVHVFQNEIANGSINVAMDATAAKRSVGVKIKDNIFGQAFSNSLVLDSPDDGCEVSGNTFTAFIPSGATYQVQTLMTLSGGTGTAKVTNNDFQAAYLCVNPLYSKCRDNKGWATYREVPFAMPAGQVTVNVPHGLVRAPVDGFARVPGTYQVRTDSFDATNVLIEVSASTGADRPGFVTVRCD